MTALDRDSKRILLAMYAEDGWRTDPRQQFKDDLASLRRLWSNLMAANKVLRSEKKERKDQIKNLVGNRLGRPSHEVARFAALRLIELYEKQVGAFLNSHRKGKGAPRRFVLTAMRMLKIADETAPGAIEAVLAKRREMPPPKLSKNYPQQTGSSFAKLIRCNRARRDPQIPAQQASWCGSR